MQNLNISLIGFFLSSNGLGQAARNIAHSLSSTSLSHTCININHNGAGSDSEFNEKCSTYLPGQINLVITGIDYTELIAGQISSMGIGKNNYFYPYWELDRIPSKVLNAISIYDKVIAPSQFIANTFQKYLDYKVPVIRQPVFIPQHIPVNRIEGGVLRIFCMMDLGSYVARKNPKGALAAFLMAFPATIKNVEFIIKIKGDRDLGLRKEFDVYCSKDTRIRVVDGDLTREDIIALINKCNVFVSLHRSEGFGFGPAEAMASGKIVVATEYGGVTDFLNNFTGYPISYKMTAVKEGEYIYGDNQMWAEPSVLHAALALQEIYNNFGRAVKRANNGRQLMMSKFSFKSIGKQFQNYFERNQSAL
jgi:glycosyltransferase involved in cell wall biosynthesis